MAQEDRFIVPHRKPAVGKSTVVSVRLPDTMLAKLENVEKQSPRGGCFFISKTHDKAPLFLYF